MVYRAKIAGVGLSVNDISQDPLVVDDTLENFDGHLKTGSPAIDSGLAVGSLGGLIPDHDLEGVSRAQGRGVDRGAYERVNSPKPDIKANGSNGPLFVSSETPVSITVSLNPGSYDAQNADWWVVELTPSSTYNHFDLSTVSMVQGLLPTYQGALFSLDTTQLLNSPNLTVGTHIFYFGVDLNMNGSLDMNSIYYDSVGITVTGP